MRQISLRPRSAEFRACSAPLGNGAIVAPDPVNILNVILLGIPAQNGRAPMPPFASEMNNQQIAALANYVRTSWGNMATPNAAGLMVSKLRCR